jgi:hypothetical protein
MGIEENHHNFGGPVELSVVGPPRSDKISLGKALK